MGKDYLYRSRGSASRFRKILIAVTLVWGALLCLQFGLGYVLVTYQFTSPTNGLLMAIGAATLVITAFTWSGVVGRSMLSSVFIYRNRVSLRYRNQPARVFHFTKDAEFRLYRFPLLRKAHLRIREKGGTAVQWMSIGDAPVLVKAFREAALPLSENWTRYPAVLFLFWGSFAASVVFDRPIGVWLAGGALFSWLYSIGFFQKPPLPDDTINPHRGNQIQILGHSLATLGGMWAVLAAQQIAFSEADRSYFETQKELREGKYSLGVSHAVRLAEQTETSLHLNFAAWVLTTVPDPLLRDYARAQELAGRALVYGDSPQVQDTLACALMGSGKKDEAIALAEKASLEKRLPTFAEGKLCEDPTLFAEASRSLASETSETSETN